MKKIISLVLLLQVLCCWNSAAQKTNIFLDKNSNYKNGVELFDKKKYGSALHSFQEVINENKDLHSLTRIDAEYYTAACAIELFHKDGEWRMKKFIEEHSENPKVGNGYFYLGKSNFRKKKYAETIIWLEKVEVYGMTKEDLSELYFKRGYSYLEEGAIEKAKLDLYEIKDVDNKYAHPANYYYSHISYTEKNYSTAIEGFTRLIDNETFGTVVPYYIAQIYFLQEKYDDVIRVAPALLNDSIHAQKSDEINRIIGESYFMKKDYANALPYLLKKKPFTAGDHYQLAYSYYKINDFTKAIPYFENAASYDDSISQNAMYHLADCYIKLNDKVKARNAYYTTSSMDFNPQIGEDALFSYARLSYELGLSPYNEAISSFRKFIKTYPDSRKKDEAYTYLVNCFHSTKNYLLAMKTIDQIPSPDLVLKAVYQKLAHFHAIDYFNNNKPDSAKKYFNVALSNNSDAVLSAMSKYWLGEIQFNNKEYSNALLTWKEFQLMQGSFNQKEYDLANYNIGYAYFMNKNYSDAGLSLRKFLISKNTTDPLKVADASIRTGDCYFMNKEYSLASDQYETAIALNKIDMDYAIYQKGMCNGLSKNYKEKINDLKMLESKYPNSNYITSSIYEIAESYKVTSQWDEALVYYKKVTERYPNSSYFTSSLISSGMIHYNNHQDEKAFSFLDQVVKQNPKSDEAQSILPIIKEIFKNQGKLEERDAYLITIGSSMDQLQVETDYYEKASKLYFTDKNCDLAFPEMQTYLAKFPNGKYATEANFCSSECAYSKAQYDEALKGYLFVISKSRNIHTEISLVKSSFILFKNKKYQEALPIYLQLEELGELPQNKLNAKIGAMRCAYNLGKLDTAINEANNVLSTDKITQQQIMEARIIRAKCLYNSNRKDDALIEYRYISKNSKNETGAEAHYYIASILFDQTNFKDAEKAIYALVNFQYSTNDWNTKGMLLAADIYVSKKDEISAEATLNTIIENADKQEYIDEAKKKLAALKEAQKLRMIPKEVAPETMKVQFENSDSNNELFDKPAQTIIAPDTLQINTDRKPD